MNLVTRAQLRKIVDQNLRSFLVKSKLDKGESLLGKVRGYFQNHRGLYVGIRQENNDSYGGIALLLASPDLLAAFDKLEPARGDLINIERLSNAGRRHRYVVRVLSRNPWEDRSYYRKKCRRKSNKTKVLKQSQ